MKSFNLTICLVAILTLYFSAYVTWRNYRGMLGCGTWVLTQSGKGVKSVSAFEYYGFYPAIWLEVKYIKKMPVEMISRAL
jgi:hypothetical protein